MSQPTGLEGRGNDLPASFYGPDQDEVDHKQLLARLKEKRDARYPAQVWIGRPASTAKWVLFLNLTDALDARHAGWQVRQYARD